MVNFQNETTITRPRQDIILFNILERRQDLLDKFRDWKELGIKSGGSDPRKLAVFQASLITLAEEVRAMLSEAIIKDKDKTYKDYDTLLEDIESEDEDKIIKGWRFIDTLLYSKGVTKGDTREVTDRYDIWKTNRDTLGVKR